MLFLSLVPLRAALAQYIHPDSTSKASAVLENRKKLLLAQLKKGHTTKTIDSLLRMGMWEQAKQLINLDHAPSDAEYQLLSADYSVAVNDFKRAEELVNFVVAKDSQSEKGLLLKAYLEIQAWRLPAAAEFALKAKRHHPASEAASLMLGRVMLLQKKYKEAMAVAKALQAVNVNNAGAYLLEADVYFWNQQPDKAEAPLFKSLELDPFNADARFSYGYAIWRRIDATQLNAMAAQWELALSINPLHYQTHWHWGNGHTNLTYADYAGNDDDEVRKRLDAADVLAGKNDLDSAVALTREAERQYPGSVLPLMHRASVYYNSFNEDRLNRLELAEQLFREVLRRKKHYGPAHNGLAAVIKSKRIPYLAAYDSIAASLKNTKIKDMRNFLRVFPDVGYYAGETVKAMVWNQLYTSVVYFPFLSRLGESFRIPPLHRDLAITMKFPSFRSMTTFDNRQWMDIRGVGSGAAAIEYAEKGAFMERNVVLHEYVHLFHGAVLTDAENRKIRSLYYKAMKNGRTLDYYSQNNESEYFAQTYPAYFEPVKVHPQDFKSMNTSNDLMGKDPEMYDFLVKLVKKEKAYLAGDEQAMAANWAEVYVKLSYKSGNSERSSRYLDTAMTYDSGYLPAFLRMAQLKQFNNDLPGAERWLNKAKAIDSAYAPIYVEYANLASARYAAKQTDRKTALKRQVMYLERSLKLEGDLQELARLNQLLRELYYRNGMIPEAIKSADAYVKSGAVVSTYLRDRKDDARAFSALLRSETGELQQVGTLEKLVMQKPQNFEYRNMYADVLANRKEYSKAIETLKEAQRILRASGNARSDYDLRIASFYGALYQNDSAATYLAPFLNGGELVRGADQLRYIRLLIVTGHRAEATRLLRRQPAGGDPLYLADYYRTLGNLKRAEGLSKAARIFYMKARTFNPYFLKYKSVSLL